MTLTARKISSISIIIPTFNEAENIRATVGRAQNSAVREIIVVDCGSTDSTTEIASQLGAQVISSTSGRAKQMNAGAQKATGEILLFLHADTLLPPDFAAQACKILASPGVAAGAFSLAIDLSGAALRVVECAANFRANVLQMPYGDQGLFLYRQKFMEVKGYPDEPILEDLLLIHRLKKTGRIGIAPSAALTSGRRWQRLGVIKTSLINQAILLGYLFGVSAQRLQGWYRIAQKF